MATILYYSLFKNEGPSKNLRRKDILLQLFVYVVTFGVIIKHRTVDNNHGKRKKKDIDNLYSRF